DTELALADHRQTVTAEGISTAGLTRGFQRVENPVQCDADGGEDPALKASVVDDLHRPRAAQYVDERFQIADCERVDEKCSIASCNLEEAQRPKVEGSLDIEPNNISGAQLFADSAESRRSVDPLHLVAWRGWCTGSGWHHEGQRHRLHCLNIGETC